MVLGLLCFAGCAEPPPSVVVYTALDEEFSRPLFEPFHARTGIVIRPKFDTEATKSVGLVNTILGESTGGRARCDVFWNNEILGTLRLAQRGLLRPIEPATGSAIPAAFKAADGTWYGFAARARILIVNRKLVAESESPRGLADLSDARWRGRVGMAKPLFGTTATHAACLFAAWGPRRARDWFLALKENEVQILAGNKHVAQSVAAGTIAVGLTDTDDAIVEMERGQPVRIIYPDSAADQMGTLFIPNTVSCLRGSANPAGAERFADYLLSPEVESTLARGPSAQIPLNPAVAPSPRVKSPREIHAMPADFTAALEHWDEAMAFLDEQLLGP
jgi:iron(III) transport system substrate-binding protein